MKRILLVMHHLNLGGAERVVLNIANNLISTDLEVHFCLFKNEGELISEIDQQIQVHYLNVNRVRNGFFKLRHFIKKLNPDVVFSSITRINIFLGIYKGFPTFKKYRIGARMVNNLTAQADLSKSYKRKLENFLLSKSLNNLDFIILQSNYMKEDFLRSFNVDDSKLYVINNPLDTSAIDRQLKKHEDKSLFPDNQKNIVTVGGLRKQKNQSFLIECFNYLPQKFHLYIIGEGSERMELEALIKKNNLEGQITLLGKKENPYRYMEQADLFCLTSHYEGFPNVIIEANYCGLFVVAKKAPGVDSEIIQEGLNGSLVNENNPFVFSKRIEKYVNYPFRKREIIRMSKKYSVQEIIRDYKNIFDV